MSATVEDKDAIRSAFAEQARRPEAGIDLAHSALLLAAEATPGLDVDSYLARLDDLAARIEPDIRVASQPEQAVERLNQLLFEQEGFRGNDEDYYDPRNSFLSDVLDRRRGIPISLSVLYIEVARRVGLDACGIGFPGHFLARVAGDRGILVDPFHGRVVTADDCAAQLRENFGAGVELSPEMLEPMPRKRILVRMLANLKQIYTSRNELEAALSCSDRMLLLEPDAALEVRDRGLLFQALECHSAAQADLERFLELAPGHESAPQIQQRLEELRRLVATIH